MYREAFSAHLVICVIQFCCFHGVKLDLRQENLVLIGIEVLSSWQAVGFAWNHTNIFSCTICSLKNVVFISLFFVCV
jgi:hypothetical protein